MKTLLLIFSFLLLLTSEIFSQNYSCVIPNQVQYFQVDSPFYYPLPNEWIIPQVNNSPIKVLNFDSANVIGGDIYRYGFYTWRDTAQFTSIPCADINGPFWLGSKEIEMANGTSVFFTGTNDTVKIKTQAAVNDSWHLYKYSNGNYVRAKVDSIVWMQMAGISDSVKCISLYVYDSTGSAVTWPYINGKSIFISKSNGLFKSVVFRDFPDNNFNTYHRRAIIPIPTVAQMFDFNVNDEFEYQTTYSIPYYYYKILAKNLNNTLDSVIYQLQRISKAYQYNCCPVPHLDSIFTIDSIITIYPYTSAPYFRGFPEQNIYSLPDSMTLLNYVVNIDSNYNYRPLYDVVGGYMGKDSMAGCYAINNFEPIPTTSIVSPGLGFVENSSDYSAIGGQFEGSIMIWYHKGNETWGNYFTVITGVRELYGFTPNILLYPNPNKGIFTLEFEKNNTSEARVEIINMLGEVVYKDVMQAGQNKKEVHFNNLSSGIYTCRIISNENVIQKMFVVR